MHDEMERATLASIALEDIRLKRPFAVAFKSTQTRGTVVGAFIASLRGEPEITEQEELVFC